MGVVLIFRDVTEQRRTETAVRASEARKAAILETALDCIITMDHEGNVVEFNPAAERTFGYGRDQVIGQELCQFIVPPPLRDRHRTGMAHYLATGEGPVLGRRLELSALRADGTEIPVGAMLSTVLLSFGVPLLLGGDEIGRTQQGNNNAYCQDNEITWFDWSAVDEDLLAFTRRLIALRTRTRCSGAAATSPVPRPPSSAGSPRRDADDRRRLGRPQRAVAGHLPRRVRRPRPGTGRHVAAR